MEEVTSSWAGAGVGSAARTPTIPRKVRRILHRRGLADLMAVLLIF
jgi:hypothetical protein